MTPSYIAILISFSSFCFAVWIGLKGNKRTDVKDIEERAKENAAINYKLDEISRNTTDIKSDISNITSDVKSISERLVVVEESTKASHNRLDLLEALLVKGDAT